MTPPESLHPTPAASCPSYPEHWPLQPTGTREHTGACLYTQNRRMCVSNIPRMTNPRFSCCMLCFLPPHSVHWMPYWDSNLCVRKKFRTEPSREKARVSPNARASSFPRNQNAVIRFWTTERHMRFNVAFSLVLFHGCVCKVFGNDSPCLLSEWRIRERKSAFLSCWILWGLCRVFYHNADQLPAEMN